MLNNESEKYRVKSIQDIKNETTRNRKAKEIRGKKRITALCILFCISLLVLIGLKISKKNIMISVNGNHIGVVEDSDEARRLLEQVKKEMTLEAGALDIQFNEKVETISIKENKEAIDKDEEIIVGLKHSLTYKVKSFAVVIGGVERVILENEDQVNRIFNAVKDEYDDEDKDKELDFFNSQKLIEEHFNGDVRIEAKFVDKKDILTDEEAVEILGRVEKEQVYTVRSNETVWTIAQKHSITVEEILSANEGFTENEILRVGQQINLVVPMPLLAVITYVEQKYESDLEPPVEKVKRNDKYEDYSNVLEEGKSGVKEVTLKIKKVNNKETSREIVKETEIVKPVTKVVEVGTKTLPSKPLKGLFTLPTRGIFTSMFGEKRDGYYHKGVDIANDTGTEIFASYTGTVSYAGTQNGFGNVIKITHSNGYETVYAHLSKILVKKGQEVKKGELVAKMGSTGNSTGPHLHFELKKDGTAKNPMDFIN